MKKIFLLCLFALLTSCKMYQPVPEGWAGATATISDGYGNYVPKKTDTSVHYFVLKEVNGKEVITSLSFARSNMTPSKDIREAPNMWSNLIKANEENRYKLLGVVFYSNEIQALSNDMVFVEHEFSFTPEPNIKYTVKGKLGKEKSTIWLEDEQGNIVPGSLGESS